MSQGVIELGIGDTGYRWEELSFDRPVGRGWAHDGVAVLHDGSVLTAAPDRGALLRFNPGGELASAAATEMTVMHGITVVEDDGQERLWVADMGVRPIPGVPEYRHLLRPGRAALLGLDGSIVHELDQPDQAAYEQHGWMPCSVAVDEARFGGSGRIWVADGYSQSLLHCYAPDGRWLSTLDGTTSGKRFSTPHGIVIDRRRGEPELYVADRGNQRIVVFDLDGGFRRCIGEGRLTSPSALALSGDLLVVAELFGSLAFFDADDAFVGVLGHDDEDGDKHESKGWPNVVDDEGNTVRPPKLMPGKFNSPHGVAATSGGDLYVSEWLIGGRFVKLACV